MQFPIFFLILADFVISLGNFIMAHVDLQWWLLLIATAAYFLIIGTCIYVVLSENRNPIRSLSWVIALLFLPFIGLVFYLFFGRSLKGMRLISKRNKRKLMRRNPPHRHPLDSADIPDSQRVLLRMIHNICRSPLALHNKIEIFTDGSSKFAALERDILNARKSIYLQYYIFNDDALGHKIAGLLKQKVAEGLDVRVLYDHVGSFSARSKFFENMAKAGILVHPFFRVSFPQLANRINWRNHRKVCVIDNKIGYIGGMNIADRYLHGLPNGSVWRDTHYRLRGDIVEQLFYSFMIDWNFKNPTPDFPAFTPSEIDERLPANPMQLITSGPTDPYSTISLIFLKAIADAKKNVYIQTPYFLPTDSLLQALKAASLAKIDVRIMIPAHSDSRLLNYASYSYITQSLKAGIKFYLYKPGMIHSKTLVIDDDIVSIGSTNFDFRSFENNFECNAMVYSKEITSRVKEDFFNDISHCDKLQLQQWRKRPLRQRAMESVVRLFAPIL